MGNTSDHTLLTEQEAAALLQPYVHNKSAMAWLAHDRQSDPVIPFMLLQGEPYYREGDLIFFVTHTLDPKARFIRVHNQLNIDHRNLSDRRGRSERRQHAMIHLQQGIERRRRDSRRMRGESARRSQPAT